VSGRRPPSLSIVRRAVHRGQLLLAVLIAGSRHNAQAGLRGPPLLHSGTALSCSVPAENAGAPPTSISLGLGLRRSRNTKPIPSTRSPLRTRRSYERQCCPGSRGPELLTQCRIVEFSLVLFQSHRHCLFLLHVRRPDLAVAWPRRSRHAVSGTRRQDRERSPVACHT